MQPELKRIQRELGTTFVYVTHDQEEALAMSDRIAVMNAGRVEQIGRPREIYEHPQTPFVADFIGSLNALELVVAEVVGDLAVGRSATASASSSRPAPASRAGDAIRVAVRPERVRIDPAAARRPDDGSRLGGEIAEVVYLGMFTQFQVETAAGAILCHRLADEDLVGVHAATPRSCSPGRSTRRDPRSRHRRVGSLGSGLARSRRAAPRRGDARSRPRRRRRSDTVITTTATAITSGSRLGKRSAP